jgi:small conductance mechanosensitive channel
MEDLHVVDSINDAGSWLVTNQALLLSYAVNIVAAIAIIIVGMIVARMISNTVNKLMRARHIDATVADFLSALVRYGVIAFTLIAALGRVGYKPPRSSLYWVPPVWQSVWRYKGHSQTWPPGYCW